MFLLLKKPILVWGAVLWILLLIQWIGGAAGLAEYASLLTTLTLIAIPAIILLRTGKEVDPFEKSWVALLRSLKILAGFSLILFPLLVLLNHFFQTKVLLTAGLKPIVYHYVPVGLAGWKLIAASLANNGMVALGEEYFFRWYFLGELKTALRGPENLGLRVLGVRLGPAFFLTAAAFTVSHSVMNLRWWHFAIFFPSLAFGWLREKSGFLTAPILFHALSNAFVTWITLHYRPS